MPFSQGWTLIVRASSRVTLATWLIGTMRAVVLDVHLVEQAGVGAAGADLLQVALERLDRPGHLLLGRLLDVCDASSA